jgi:hypothetical protein
VKTHLAVLALLAALCFVQMTCSAIPRGMTRERDIDQREAGYPDAEQTLLVASRSSEFKEALVRIVRDAFEEESVAVTLIGLENLRDEKAGDYDAVVLINTCIAWSLDPQVDAFLHKYRDASNIIVVTTSGDGECEPKKQNREFDTVASASEVARVDEVADEIVGKVRALLGP